MLYYYVVQVPMVEFWRAESAVSAMKDKNGLVPDVTRFTGDRGQKEDFLKFCLAASLRGVSFEQVNAFVVGDFNLEDGQIRMPSLRVIAEDPRVVARLPSSDLDRWVELSPHICGMLHVWITQVLKAGYDDDADLEMKLFQNSAVDSWRVVNQFAEKYLVGGAAELRARCVQFYKEDCHRPDGGDLVDDACGALSGD